VSRLSKLNRDYTEWTYVGYLEGEKDFPESDPRFQMIFAPGEYYAMFDKNSDTWFFTQSPVQTHGEKGRIDYRYPHYTVTFTGNGAETYKEHFTYDEKQSIYPSNFKKGGTMASFNRELSQIVAEYPDVADYYIKDYKGLIVGLAPGEEKGQIAASSSHEESKVDATKPVTQSKSPDEFSELGQIWKFDRKTLDKHKQDILQESVSDLTSGCLPMFIFLCLGSLTLLGLSVGTVTFAVIKIGNMLF
jgi:hypothetical protein